MEISTSDDGAVIYLSPKFDFTVAEVFRDIYEQNKASNYTLDFRNTEYMDSSGLGMLINMKRAIGGKPIQLINCKPQIKRVLIISRFDEHFQIS